MKAKRIQIIQAKEGMVVAEDIYTNRNELILNCNTVLTNTILNRLKQYGIFHFSVYEPEVEEENIEETKENTAEVVFHKESIRKTEEFQAFKEEFDVTVQGLRKSFGRILDNDVNDGIAEMAKQVEYIIGSGHGTLHVMDMLNCMREYDDVTFAHSISVSVLCNLIGEWLQLKPADLKVLILSGLLHDIGKLQVSNEIISKPGKLTSEEFKAIQEHPKFGFEILKDRDLDPRIKHAALMHHERCDGTGYPGKVSSSGIEYFSKIVSVADVYDAMTADRSYRKGMCPFEVLEIMKADGYLKYDPAILMMFMEKTVQSYINATVQLSDGRIGEIISISKDDITRPLIRIGTDFADLKKEKGITITKIL